MNIAIVDDEQREIDTLSDILKEYAALSKLPLSLQIFHSAEELLPVYRPYAYTAIFMDIYMSGMTGIAAAEQILSRDRHALIIFLTTSAEYMPEAFSMHAYDYISKPAKEERLFKVMDDALMRQTEYQNSPKLTFSWERRNISLPYSDIICIKTGKHNYLEIIDTSNNTFLTRQTFSEVTRSLTGDGRFLTVLRGVLVNMEHIIGMEKGICRLSNGTEVPVSIKNAKELEATWQNYIFDRIRIERQERRNRK